MARTIEKSRASYWHDSERLHRHMGKNRWDQKHRFLCINPNSPNASDPCFFKLEPLASRLRLKCSIACIPSSWVTVDESMAGFKGRSIHKVKMPHKPIDEGFKIWCIGYGKGFVCDFLFHSAQSGPEATIKSGLVCTTPLPLKPVSLALTVQVPYILCRRLQAIYPNRQYCLFLDNLFTEVKLAHALLYYGVGLMGTARAKQHEIPQSLLKWKPKTGEEKPKLIWNSTIGEIDGYALVFIWQDNNTVLAMTTAHSLHEPNDKVVVHRRRPKATSTNASVVWPVFEGFPWKELPIPVPINQYNKTMRAIDNNNQLREGFTIHRSHEDKVVANVVRLAIRSMPYECI